MLPALLVLLCATVVVHGLFSAGNSKTSARPKPPRLGTVRPTIVRGPTKPVDDLARAVNASVTSGPGGLSVVPRSVIDWFLMDRYYDARRASEKLLAMASWRRSFAVETRGVDTSRERRSRKGYLHGHRDVLNRPVVIAVAARHNCFLRSLPESKLLCVQVLEEAIRGLDAADASAGESPGGDKYSVAWTLANGQEGGVTQVLGVFDLRNLQPTCIDFEFVSFLIETIYQFYPQRLGQVLLVEPPPFIFEAAWEVIRPQLGRHADIVRFVKLEELKKEYFTPETLPRDFR